MAIGLTVTKPFTEKYGSWYTLIDKSMHAKVMAIVLDTKINLTESFNLHIFWWMYQVYAGSQFL